MEINDICVIGGGGFVGRHIVHLLAARGLRVRVPARDRERAKELILLPTVDVVDADVHDPAALAELVARRRRRDQSGRRAARRPRQREFCAGARRTDAQGDRRLRGGRRAPLSAHERAGCRRQRPQPLPANQGRGRGAGARLEPRLDDFPAVGDLRARRQFSQSVRQTAAADAGHVAGQSRMRVSSRSTSRMSRRPSCTRSTTCPSFGQAYDLCGPEGLCACANWSRWPAA